MIRRALAAVTAAAALVLTGCAGTAATVPPATVPPATAAVEPGPGRFIEEGPFPVAGLPDQRLTIWLPPGYDRSERPFPVLYMHDGHNLFDPASSNFNKVWAVDKALTRLVAEGRIEPHIVVGIWAPGADRYRQYLPAFVVSQAQGAVAESIAGLTGGKPVVSDRYLAWLADDLKPRIDRTYRTRPAPADTAIAGSSMGGLMSCYAILERPDVFGRAACVSSHWPMTLPEVAEADSAAVKAIWQGWIDARLGQPDGRRIWMDHGTGTLDAYYPPYQDAVDARFRAAGWAEGQDWTSRDYPGAEHEENAWAARLPEVLGWVLAPVPAQVRVSP